MCTGEANYFRYYKRLGVIAKLAASYMSPCGTGWVASRATGRVPIPCG
jgi:hypothetical protein